MLPQLHPKFQHWSEGGSVYIYSDTHFDDFDCKIMSANWPTPAEQIDLINDKVKKNDTLVLLGDIGDPKYISQIKAHYKILLTGNHDSGASKYKNYFNEIYTGPLFISEKILLSHEPIDLPFVLNIHGHTHDREGFSSKDKINQFNVCSNCINFIPQDLGSIIKTGVLKKIDNIHRITIDKASNKNI